jgi:general secretion pathway protein C
MVSLDLQRLKLPTEWAGILTKLPNAANILMVIVIASTLASLTWRLLPTPDVPDVPASLLQQQRSTTMNTSSTASRPAATRNLANLHLFGEAREAEPEPVVQEVPEEAPDTSLALTLRGVIAGVGANSWAIISDRSGNEETYGIDSPLPGGATLKEIYPDRVILLHNNRFETLRLPEEAGVARSSRFERPNSRRTTSRRSPVSRPTGAVTRMGPEVSRVVSDYKQKLLNDPQSVMGVVRAEPYRRGGKLSGYRIFPGKDKDLMQKVGLQPGDVVTGVNGINLDSPLKGLEVMQQITDAKEVSVDVLRNGVSQTFVVPIN